MTKIKLLILPILLVLFGLSVANAGASVDPHLLRVATAESFASDYIAARADQSHTSFSPVVCKRVGTTRAYRLGHVDCTSRQTFYVQINSHERSRKRNEWTVHVSKTYTPATRRSAWQTTASIDGPFNYPYETGLVPPS